MGKLTAKTIRIMKLKLNFLLFFLANIVFANAQSNSDNLKLIIPFGHTGEINDFSINSKGNNMVTVGSDKKIIIWDLNTCKEIFNWIGHTDYIETVDYSIDDSKIATGSWDKTIKIWNAKNGQLLQTLIGHSEHPDKVFFMNNNNNRVVSVCNARGEHEVYIWDLITGEIIFKFYGDIAITNKREDILFVGNSSENLVSSYSLKTGKKIKDYIGLTNGDIQYSGTKSIIYSITTDQADQRLMATGGDGCPIIWNIKTGKQILKLEGHKSRIFTAGFSFRGKNIFTAGDNDQTIKIWNSKTGELTLEYKDSLAGSIRSALFSSNDKYFAFISGNSVKIFEMNNYEKVKDITISSFYGSKLSLTNNSNWFAVSCDKSVKYYDFATGNLMKELKGKTINSGLNIIEYTNQQSSLENYISGNNFIYKIGDPGSIQFIQDTLINISSEKNLGWILKNKNEIQEVKLPAFEVVNKIRLKSTEETASIKMKLSEKYIFLEYIDSIYIFNRSNNQFVKKFAGQNLTLSNESSIIGYTINQLINDPDYADQNDLLVINIDLNDTVYFYKKYDYTTKLQFSSNSKFLISLSVIGFYDGYALVHDLEQRKIIDTIGYEIPNAIFTKNNLVLYNDALSFDDRNNAYIQIRDFINHKNVGSFKGEKPKLDWDKKYYTTISNDTIHVFAEQDFLQRASLTGHSDDIENVIFNSGINKLISCSLDNQIIVWDVEKKCEIYKLILLEDENWIVQLPNSPFYMASKNAFNLLNCRNNEMNNCDMKAYDLKYNRPDLVLDSIGKFFQK
jgi:WD40 repeat protein